MPNPAHNSNSVPKPGKPQIVWRNNKKQHEPVGWRDVDAGSIRSAITAVTDLGGCIMFGVTSDGGCLSLCVLQQNEKTKVYPHDASEAEEVLADLTETYLGL